MPVPNGHHSTGTSELAVSGQVSILSGKYCNTSARPAVTVRVTHTKTERSICRYSPPARISHGGASKRMGDLAPLSLQINANETHQKKSISFLFLITNEHSPLASFGAILSHSPTLSPQDSLAVTCVLWPAAHVRVIDACHCEGRIKRHGIGWNGWSG